MGLIVQTAATEYPVKLSHLKAFMREEDGDENELIQRLINGAANWWTHHTGQALISTTFDETFAKFDHSGPMRLSRHPVSSITSVLYVDTDGNSQTASSSLYTLRAKQAPSYIELSYNQVWPTARLETDAVTIRYVAGYGATFDSVPEDIRSALEQLILSLYDNRPDWVVPEGVRMVMWQYRNNFEASC